jgi:membrane-associated protein
LHSLLDFLHTLTDPDRLKLLLVDWRAYVLLFSVVFAESGLLVGFFLPGDSLLFTVGVVAGAGQVHIAPMILILAGASMLGDASGFLIGKTLGVSLFQKNSRLFRREHLDRTQAFYERHGGKTIVYAKFVPIVRTFAAFIAGVGRMRYPRFLAFNIFGALGWVTLMIGAGDLLGNVQIVRKHFEVFVLGIVFVSLIPVALELLKSRSSKRASEVQPAAAD